MKRNIYILIILISITTIFWQCDKIEGTYIEDNSNTSGITSTKKILLEKFTGHTCGNCPRANDAAHILDSLYHDNLIIISSHVGWFADTLIPPYTEDYRTTMGTEISDYFGNNDAGLPNGMLNRKPVNGNVILSHANWASVLNQELSENAKITISLIPTYNNNTRKAKIIALIQTTAQIIGNINIVACVTEDSIVGYQKDYDANPVDIPNYVHMHVLRQGVTSTWGETIATDTIASNELYTKEIEFILKPEIVAQNSTVVVYVYNITTHEILQAEKTSLF